MDLFNVQYIPNFYTCAEADNIWNQLYKLPFKSYTFTFYGRHCTPLRKMIAYGDDGLTYPFSGIIIKADRWLPFLCQIKNDVEVALQASFNFALLNFYKNGRAYISPHKDDENCIVPDTPIACLSFGATRNIIFRKNGSKEVIKMPIEHGSLYVMKSPTNEFWTHEIPMERHVMEPRISITFRQFKN